MTVFSGGETPKVPPVTPAPSTADADRERANKERELKQRRGKKSTILTGPQGAPLGTTMGGTGATGGDMETLGARRTPAGGSPYGA